MLERSAERGCLRLVKSFAADHQDWWDEIGKEQQDAIDKSLSEMKAGKLTSQDVVLKKYKKWLKK